MQKQFHRRDFLRTSCAFASTSLLATPRLSAGANERFRIGVIGTGKWSQHRTKEFFFKRAQAQIVAVCDVDTTRRLAAKARVENLYAKETKSGNWQGCTEYADYRELLADDTIDAVIITTPDHWHAPITLAAVAAGKDVFCEKPLTHTVHESQVIMDVVGKSGQVLQTGSQQRSTREFRVAVELIRNGVIGTVRHVDVDFGPPPRPYDLPGEEPDPGLDWDAWCGPGPLSPYNPQVCPRGVHNNFPGWRNFQEYGGGGVCDFGAHHLDIAQWGLDRDGGGPVKVVASPEGEKARKGCRFEYSDGVTLAHAPADNGIIFYGENDSRIRVNRGRFELWRGTGDKDYEFISVNQLDQVEEKYLSGDIEQVYRSVDHVQDFLDAMGSRKKPIANEQVGATSALACHLMNISYRYNASFDWDPAVKQFASGTGDPSWLTKPYRDGYPLV
jgi:predicted dehydrogenase